MAADGQDLIRRHLLIGWGMLLVFLTLGVVLEAMHGFKVGWYLDVSNSTRRLMWTLAHAHGVLLALVNLAFALTVYLRPAVSEKPLASASLAGASVLLPGGFFLGGIVIYRGDPGLGILLTPIGAVLLGLAVVLTLRAVAARSVSR